jgi:hypothetical protein
MQAINEFINYYITKYSVFTKSYYKTTMATKPCCSISDTSNLVITVVKSAEFELMYALSLFTLTSFTISLTRVTQDATSVSGNA